MPDRLAFLDAQIANGSTDPFVFYARALELRSQDQPGEALAALRELIAKQPDYLPSYLMAAQLAQALGDKDSARQHAEAGVSVARSQGQAHALGELEALLAGLA